GAPPYLPPRHPSPSPSSNSPTGPKPLLTPPQPRYPISPTPPPPFLPPLPHGQVPSTFSPER
ncbi:unnamed protein product, partial [Rangifer tarandus platyrhynchus]